MMDLTECVFKSFTAEQQATIIGKSNNKGKTDLYRVLRVILVDQYVSWKTDSQLCTAISRGRNQWIVGSRYNGLHLPHRTLDVIDILITQGYLLKANYSYSRSGSQQGNRTTRIQPTEILTEMFSKLDVGLQDLNLHKDQETIILRKKGDDDAGKASDIEYEDTPLTKKMRAEVEAYNNMMQRHYVDVASLREPFIYREVKPSKSDGASLQRIDVNDASKFCRRIFSRGSFEMNGRWHGGFWQSIPKAMRRDIYIDDATTEEIDYSGIHPSILAYEQGQRLTGDRYDLGMRILPAITREQQRAAVKLLVLVAINAKSRKEAFKAYNDKASVTLKHGALGALLDAFISKYPFLEASLCTDQGIRLMNIDSQITTEIINRFVSADIPILPIHDSYIVKRENADDLRDAMLEASRKVLGAELDFESGHDAMLKKVTQAALEVSNDLTSESVIVMPYNLGDKTIEYNERYKLWKSKH